MKSIRKMPLLPILRYLFRWLCACVSAEMIGGLCMSGHRVVIISYGRKVDLSVVDSRNYSVGGQIGVCFKRILDFTLFFTYDLKPAYNQQYIYENMTDFYNTYVDHLNKRWRIGTSMVIYIPFSSER